MTNPFTHPYQLHIWTEGLINPTIIHFGTLKEAKKNLREAIADSERTGRKRLIYILKVIEKWESKQTL
jgi:hypothetical protein